MDAEDLYHHLQGHVTTLLGRPISDYADAALVVACEAIFEFSEPAPAEAEPEPEPERKETPFLGGHFTYEYDDSGIVYSEPRWVVTGCLPQEIPEEHGGTHYELEHALQKAGLIDATQCDSESGGFWCYPDDEEACKKIAAFIEEKVAKYVDAPPPSVWS